MRTGTSGALSVKQRLEVAAWLEQQLPQVPEAVRIYLAPHQKYLAAGGDPRRAFDVVWQELRRALGIIPSSEKRPSGSPRSGIPPAHRGTPETREDIEARLERNRELSDWHDELRAKCEARTKRLEKKLAKMAHVSSNSDPMPPERIPLEDIELTEEQKAETAANTEAFLHNLSLGEGADPALKSINETLMPGGSVLATEDYVELPVEVPEALEGAEVVKTLFEPRMRYDFSVAVKCIELQVEKKILVDATGERHVISASTNDYGPPRFSVTWSALATLAVLIGQFALPFNRLGTMLSTAGKRFTAASLSRMLHYVARRMLPIYLVLARSLADCKVLGGDDTTCRVLEVSAYRAKWAEQPPPEKGEPPWADYRNPAAAAATLKRCEARKEVRIQQREAGDRNARRQPHETPSLGVLIGQELVFESKKRSGDGGAKEAMHTTVVSGRSVESDPKSLIVFYRSHLGSFGNLLESLLQKRNPKAKKLIVQGDLSTTNLVTDPKINSSFDIRLVGCSAHARRPFANYEHEDPDNCEHMLHLFSGLTIHEDLLAEQGRNNENVRAVRENQSRRMWRFILELAEKMTHKWPPATKLGGGARYIINHFEQLTAYLEDPRIEPTNNLRERMLRMEKMIEKSSMFRRSLEGRFVLDIIRTVLQTAVAADVPVHEYLVAVLRADPDQVANEPHRFTPYAWANPENAA